MTPQTTSPTAPAAKTGTLQPDGAVSAPQAWNADDGLEPDQAGGMDSRAVGLPADRMARIAAGRAFVALKLSFLYVVDAIEGHEELKSRVQSAAEPIDLWALRAPVFAALTGDQAHRRSHRQLLTRSLDSMFPSGSPQLN